MPWRVPFIFLLVSEASLIPPILTIHGVNLAKPSNVVNKDEKGTCFSKVAHKIKTALKRLKMQKKDNSSMKHHSGIAGKRNLYWSDSRVRCNKRKYFKNGFDSRSRDFLDIEQATIVIINTIHNSGDNESGNIYSEIKNKSIIKEDMERNILARLTPEHFL